MGELTMIKNVKVRGNNVSFECSLKERDSLFYKGLQILADEQLGEHKVVVVPCKSPVGKLVKSTAKKSSRFSVSDKFVTECINVAFNKLFKEYIEELEAKFKVEQNAKAKKI
jgi:hypothetical protein